MNNDHKLLWQHYTDSVAMAVKHGNFTRAIRLLQEGFRAAEEYGEIDAGMVEQAYMLADLHLRLARYAEAEALFRLVLEIREKLLGPTHQDVVESLKKVAIVQIMTFRADTLGRRQAISTSYWQNGMAS